MPSDPNVKIKKYFDEFYQHSTEEANDIAEVFVNNLNRTNATIEASIISLKDELQNICDEIDLFELKEYVHFAKQKEIIHNIFSSRVLIFGKNEKSEIKKALFLNAKKNLLFKKLQGLKEQLVTFTFQQFLSNKPNLQFYDLHECPTGTSQYEYLKMRKYQTMNKVACVELETKQLLDALFRTVDSTILFSEIEEEIAQLKNIFTNTSEWKNDKLLIEISKLKAINQKKISWSNNSCNEFKTFCSGDSLNNKLTPAYLKDSFNRIKNNQYSEPPIFCHSLVSYESCLCVLANKKLTLNEFSHHYYKPEFETTYNNSLKMADNYIDKFSSNYEFDSITPEKYADSIINELNKLRFDFKKTKVAQYYNLLHNTESLKSVFLNNCLLAEEIEKNKNALQNAIIINEMVNFLEDEIHKIENVNPDLKLSRFDIESQLDILMVQIHMAPSSETMNQLINMLLKVFSNIKNTKTPLWFIAQDFKDDIINIYNHTRSGLEDILKSTEPGYLQPYVADKLRELKIQSFQKCIKEHSLKECLDALIIFFEAQNEYLRSNQYLTPIDIDKILFEKTEDVKPKLSFKYSKSEPRILLPYIEALCVKIDFLDNRTSAENFIKITTSDDLENVTEKIYIACQTNEFAYVIKKLKTYFKSLNPANIEKSDLFRSKYDKPLKANNLYNAEFINLKSKAAINNIFNQRQ